MHELGIAQSIIGSVLDKMNQDRLDKVTAIGLRIGKLTDIVPDALQFGFEASVQGTPLASTHLVIESVPILGACRTCGCEFTVEQFMFICPHCGSRDISMIQGDELEIAYLEVEDGETT